jgi:hypothetical protein
MDIFTFDENPTKRFHGPGYDAEAPRRSQWIVFVDA